MCIFGFTVLAMKNGRLQIGGFCPELESHLEGSATNGTTPCGFNSPKFSIWVVPEGLNDQLVFPLLPKQSAPQAISSFCKSEISIPYGYRLFLF